MQGANYFTIAIRSANQNTTVLDYKYKLTKLD